jgi:ABC-type glycerol-3-phosphate transport system substrate-binding protein
MSRTWSDLAHSRRSFLKVAASALVLAPVLVACQQAPAAAPTPATPPTPQVVEKVVTQVVEKQVTQIVEKQVTTVVEKQVTTVVTAVTKPSVIPLVINASANIKNEAITGRPGPGKFGNWYYVEVLTTHMQTFMDANPGIKVIVDWFTADNSATKLLALKAANQLGDIVDGLGLPLDVAARNAIYRPLDDMLKVANFDLKNFDTNSVNALRFDPTTGKRGEGAPLYALPDSINPGATILFYNAALFQKNGVKPPTADLSFDDLVLLAKSMTQRKAGAEVADVYGWLVSPFFGGNIDISWLRDFGADMMDATGQQATLNTKEAKTYFQYIYDTIYTSKISPRPDQLTALGQYKNMFMQQKLAMFRLAPWGILALSDAPNKGETGYFEWSAIQMPKGPSGVHGSGLDASFIGMNPASKFPDEALQALLWFTNKEASTIQCFTAGMCGAYVGIASDDRVKNSPYLQTVAPTVASAVGLHHAANGRDSEVGSTYGKEFSKLLNDQAKPDAAFADNLQKLVQDILAKAPA